MPPADNSTCGWSFLFATIGADLGASINYLVAYYVGRPVIYRFANSKWGKMCLLNQEKVEKSERYFDDHGIVATLTGRLIPGIRHLISIPAGLARMHYGKFLLYTTIGAGCWHAILAGLGWYLHTIVPEEQLNDKIEEYAEYIKIGIVALVVIDRVVCRQTIDEEKDGRKLVYLKIILYLCRIKAFELTLWQESTITWSLWLAA